MQYELLSDVNRCLVRKEFREVVLNCAIIIEKTLKEQIVDYLDNQFDKIDEVIELIKGSNDKNDARIKLIKLLEVDGIQADAILDMKLAKLTRIDKNELVEEKKEKEEFITEVKNHIKTAVKNFIDKKRKSRYNYS